MLQAVLLLSAPEMAMKWPSGGPSKCVPNRAPKIKFSSNLPLIANKLALVKFLATVMSLAMVAPVQLVQFTKTLLGQKVLDSASFRLIVPVSTKIRSLSLDSFSVQSAKLVSVKTVPGHARVKIALENVESIVPSECISSTDNLFESRTTVAMFWQRLIRGK